ncbi:Vesicular glutamate transporter 3 [Trichinella zimbabwensis]|uniref:Vesicular glutamate transporter 3 n=1 Tax=Trichinella zimbabwensis TaxID=268475 RepID=A0A0V1H5B2_9BILA|nr:Vesicular glutamate transporter 3 [Trichinella zimbabwensis]
MSSYRTIALFSAIASEMKDQSKSLLSKFTFNLAQRSPQEYDQQHFIGEFEDDSADPTKLRRKVEVAARSNFILKISEKCPCCKCSKRWQLAWLACIGFLIVFGIRCNIGAAKVRMTRNFTDPWGVVHPADFDWNPSVLGVVEGSFFYGYLITQVPGGFIAARFPATTLFGGAIGITSALNLLMPVAVNSGYGFAIVIQILQGLAQGVAYPAVHGMWRYWAPPLERTKLATTTFTGSYAGAVVGLPLSAMMTSYVSWSAAFYFYVLQCAMERNSKIKVRMGNTGRQLLPKLDILLAADSPSGFIAALPHVIMAAVVLLGGQLADFLRSRRILSTTAVRKLFNCGGFGMEGLFLIICAYVKQSSAAIFCLVMAVGFSGFAISGFNVNHLDIAPRYASILMGMSNGLGTFSGMICPIVTEKLTKYYHENGWVTVLLTAGLIHFTGITFYAFFASGEQQPWSEPPDEEITCKATDMNMKTNPQNFNTSGSYGTVDSTSFTPLTNNVGQIMYDKQSEDSDWSYYQENTDNEPEWPYGNSSLTNKNFYDGY